MCYIVSKIDFSLLYMFTNSLFTCLLVPTEMKLDNPFVQIYDPLRVQASK